MNQPIPKPTKQELELTAEAAKEALELARSEADDLAAEAGRLDRVFKTEPSEEVFAKKAVALQKAENARTALSEAEQAHLRAAEAVRRFDREALSVGLEAQETAVRARFARAADALRAGLTELDGAIADLARMHSSRLQAQKEGARVMPLSLESIVNSLAPRFAEFQGRNAHERASSSVRFSFEPNRSLADLCVVFEAHRPASAIPATLR